MPTTSSRCASELFSADQMEQHGEVLAESHKDARAHGAGPAAAAAGRERSGAGSTPASCSPQAVEGERRITPAGEWLLDNFYLIEEQIRTARRHLPKRYSRELPRLAQRAVGGTAARLRHRARGDLARRRPRRRRKPEPLRRRLPARHAADARRAVGDPDHAAPGADREPAPRRRARRGRPQRARPGRRVGRPDDRASRRTDPKSLILVIADMARSNPPMASAFVAELARRLQGQSAALALPLTWIEQPLAESGLTIEQLVQAESQQQAADQVSISNSIGSLRFLAAMDWREFVETHERRRADAARGSRPASMRRWTSPRATATATRSRTTRASAAALDGSRGRAQAAMRAGAAQRQRRTGRRRSRARTSATT